MRKDILIPNDKSCVALCTLWSRKEEVYEALGETGQKINVVGNLYTGFGINYLLHTLLERPQIRFLIVWGADLSNTGEMLKKLWESGLSDGKIPGTTVRILIPEKYVELLRKKVKLIDLRGKPLDTVKEIIERFWNSAEPWGEPILLQLPAAENIESFPSHLSGYFIYETSVFRAWAKALRVVMRYGVVKGTEYGNRQKEFHNLMITVDISENLDMDRVFEFLERKEVERYASEMMSSELPEGVEYTYGYRLSRFFGIDQVDYIVDKLLTHPYSRRAVAITWDPRTDTKMRYPPCLILVQAEITKDELILTGYLRSNDMFRAWPINFLGLVELGKRIVTKLNSAAGTSYKLGKVTTISSSAHVYEYDWEAAKKVFSSLPYEFLPDPFGNFLIRIENGEIVVSLIGQDGSVIKEWRGNGNKIFQELRHEIPFLLPEHAFYLGKELAYAEMCLKNKRKYVSDVLLELPEY